MDKVDQNNHEVSIFRMEIFADIEDCKKKKILTEPGGDLRFHT